jgi:hypothetical protein
MIAVLSGVLVGCVIWHVHRPRMRVAALVALSISIGVLVSAISGEIIESWAFVLVDTAQVAFAAVATLVVLTRFRPLRGMSR